MVPAADSAIPVSRMALAERAAAWEGRWDVSPVLAAVANLWRGEAYDWTVFSVGESGLGRFLAFGLGGVPQLPALREGLIMEDGGLPNVTGI